MRKNLTHALAAIAALLFAAPAFADGRGNAGPDVAAPPVRAQPLQPTAEPSTAAGRTGIIPLGEAGLSINVPEGYRFYSAEEAQRWLQRNNAAAPSGVVYGLLAPASADINQPGTWATVVSYDAIGYVQPETASGLADTNFEGSVRDARQAQSRTFEGFAATPAFEPTAPTLTWAERIAAPGSQGKDLRYEQKVLGKSGVAGLTSIGSADQMTEIAAAAADMQAMLSFAEGQRHQDFQPASDQVSQYSVPGLVTGVPNAEAQALAEGASTTGTGQTAFGGLSGYFPWIALGVIVLAGAGYMAMRKRGGDDDEEEEAA
jgi:uncharacterized membrane-anchored protein